MFEIVISLTQEPELELRSFACWFFQVSVDLGLEAKKKKDQLRLNKLF